MIAAIVSWFIGEDNDRNWIRTRNHLVRKRALNHLAKLANLSKWLSVSLWTKWLWVRIPLLSPKLQIWRLLRARSSLIFRQTIEYRFPLKLVRTWQWYTEKDNVAEFQRFCFLYLKNIFESLCMIYYNFYNLRNLKITHGRIILLVKLQALAKSNTPPWIFFTFLIFYK